MTGLKIACVVFYAVAASTALSPRMSFSDRLWRLSISTLIFYATMSGWAAA